MNVTRRLAAAVAATIVLAGCAAPAGDTAAPDSTGAATEATSEPVAGHAAHEEHGDAAASAPETDGEWTADEIAAAFNAHAGAHAHHGQATETRVFPSGITPTRIRIPVIGVDAPVTDLSLAGAEPEVPADFAQVGWYQQTRRPGEIGPAVLAGHVDSRSGPAVFVDLDELAPGDEIVVADADGEERRFVVDELGQYPKDALPPEVFGFGGPQPDLRLITCGGSFDRASGHYRDNVVVYASLADA